MLLFEFIKIILSPNYLSAESTKDPFSASSIFLKPLIVEATRSPRPIYEIPYSIQRIEPTFSQSTAPIVTLNKSLENALGIFFQNPFNYAQDLRLSIRGFGMRAPFGIRGIKVIVDGIPETLPDGQTQIDVIDPGLIGKIEVIRGPSSSLYGNASGGLISLKTKLGPEKGIRLQTKLQFGEFGLIKKQVHLGGNKKRFRFNLFLSRFQWNGFRVHSETQQSQVRGKFKFSKSSNSEWVLILGHFNSPQANDAGGLTIKEVKTDQNQANQRNIKFNAGERVQQQNLGIRYYKNLSNNKFSTTIYLIRRLFSNKLPFKDGGSVNFDRYVPGLTIKWIKNHPLLEYRFISGIDFALQNDRRKRFNNNHGEQGDRVFDQRERVASVGPYFRSEWRANNNWNYSFGVRYDTLWFNVKDSYLIDGNQSGEQSLTEWSSSLGAIYHANNFTNIFANISTVFETPTTTELFNDPGGKGGFNLDLKPQTAINYEIGFKGKSSSEDLGYELSLFYITSTDEIIPFQDSSFPGRSFFKNAGKTERLGVELGFNYRLFNNLNFRLSYIFSNYKFCRFYLDKIDINGKSFPGTPDHNLFYLIEYKNTLGFFGKMTSRFVDSFYANNINSIENPSYVLSNIELGRQGSVGEVKWSAVFGLNNIFDQSYNANVRINAANERFFEPGPPFNFFGGLSLTYVFE